ncbi:flavin reductase family protein [Lewinella sp. JB7]|uniref:flavin reductase family protein n=1 Tax=Lewinella sp. JB7 TaxID=2962887 RepID=UPI0020C9A7AC|nr:flavin reductase [Lewinella sp. JB7]MCP9234314.1 flavin reductase family protein [Lewinella sp. JB7]
MQLTPESLSSRDRNFRRNFYNTLPGPRGVHLIGTKGHRGTENLGVFSSVVHLGASPALLGFHLRPLTVPRHTYHHLKARGWFTLNTLHPDFLRAAHQTSANYPLGESEFAATGLTPLYSENCPAPYVKESPVRIGLTFEEEHHIAANDTLFIVGRVREVFVPDEAVEDSGHVNHETLQSLTVTGLDTYFRSSAVDRLPYARP